MKPFFQNFGKIGILVLFGTGFWLLSTGFQKEDQAPKTVEELINQKVDERIQKYEQTTIKRCRDKVLKEADRLVDSILIARARKLVNLIDTLERPGIPDRPEMPSIPSINDSIPIAPLLDPKDTMNVVVRTKTKPFKIDSFPEKDSTVKPTITLPDVKKASN